MKLKFLTKLLVGVLVLCGAMFFVGCSDDDEGSKEPDYSHLSIVGTWVTTIPQSNYDYEITITVNKNGTGKEEQVAIQNGNRYPVEGSPMSFNWTGNENSFRITSGSSCIQSRVDLPYEVTDGGTKLKITDITFTKK